MADGSTWKFSRSGNSKYTSLYTQFSMAVSAQNPLSSKYICNFSFILYYLFKNTKVMLKVKEGFPGGLDSKEFACNAGDLGSIPGSGRSPTERNGNLIQYSCLQNFMDRGIWQAIVHGVAKSWTQLSN